MKIKMHSLTREALIIFITLILNNYSAWTSPVNDLEIDKELADAIDRIQPNFAGNIKRGFTNVNIQKYRTKQKPTEIQFETIFFKDNRNDITIKDLHTTSMLAARLIKIQSDLSENVLLLTIDLGDIQLEGEYEMINADQINLLPISNRGAMNITIQNVMATGKVGFTAINDTFTTTNYDLNYSTSFVNTEVVYYGMSQDEKITSFISKPNIDESLFGGIRQNVFWKLQKHIKFQLNTVLNDISLTDLFDHNADIIQKYNQRALSLNGFVNNLADNILKKVKNVITENGLASYKIDDFHSEFSHSWSFVTFWGGLTATNGFARDLSTVYRTSDFSVGSDMENEEFTIFGALGLNNLGMGYNNYHAHIYNIGPKGSIKSTAGFNSVAFKVTMSALKNGFQIKRYDLRVEQLEDIDVETTGLSYGLDWLASTIVKFMVGLFKTDIIETVENKLKGIVDDLIKNKISFGVSA